MPCLVKTRNRPCWVMGPRNPPEEEWWFQMTGSWCYALLGLKTSTPFAPEPWPSGLHPSTYPLFVAPFPQREKCPTCTMLKIVFSWQSLPFCTSRFYLSDDAIVLERESTHIPAPYQFFWDPFLKHCAQVWIPTTPPLLYKITRDPLLLHILCLDLGMRHWSCGSPFCGCLNFPSEALLWGFLLIP